MKATEVTQHYHNTWNGRDSDALVATFTKDGTYCNPDPYPARITPILTGKPSPHRSK
jgi:ketosteroid isomerase-like protein